MKNYLTPDIDVRRGDVLSAWAGIRPLVKDPNAEDTQSLGLYSILSISFNTIIYIFWRNNMKNIFIFKNFILKKF